VSPDISASELVRCVLCLLLRLRLASSPCS
jgi:hypothetical protein